MFTIYGSVTLPIQFKQKSMFYHLYFKLHTKKKSKGYFIVKTGFKISDT